MKLTKQLRAAIIANCLQHTFAQREAALEQKRQELADVLYMREFGDVFPITAKLQKHWFRWQREIHISCDGFTHWGNKPESPCRLLAMSHERPMPAHIAEQFTIKKGDALFPRAAAIVQLHQGIHADRRKLELHLQTLLETVSTLEKLRTLWPEGEEFFPKVPEKKTLPVPAGLRTAVNKMMGLK